jgi:NAD(P)H-flavin reductase
MNSVLCELYNNTSINEEYFTLQFIWECSVPKAGQFFMIKPERTSVFLPRPIGIFEYDNEQKLVKFLISRRGRGTIELSQVSVGEKVLLTGPIGNCWERFLPESTNGKIGLVGGSAGIAPLAALVAEKPDYNFHFFAGFKQGFREKEEEDAIIGSGVKSKKLIISAEDGRNALIGRITDFMIDLESFDCVFGCGPLPMLNALKKKCESKNVACYLSLESRLACGVGACLGCTIQTSNGLRCCCKDGPIFSATEVMFDE